MKNAGNGSRETACRLARLSRMFESIVISPSERQVRFFRHFAGTHTPLNYGFSPSSHTRIQTPAHAAPDPCGQGCSITPRKSVTRKKGHPLGTRTPYRGPWKDPRSTDSALFSLQNRRASQFFASENTAFPAAFLVILTPFPDGFPPPLQPSIPANKTNPLHGLCLCGIS